MRCRLKNSSKYAIKGAVLGLASGGLFGISHLLNQGVLLCSKHEFSPEQSKDCYDEILLLLPLILKLCAASGTMIFGLIGYLIAPPGPTLQERFDQTGSNATVDERFKDPVFYHLMDRPKIINSGMIYDETTLDQLRVKSCPLTRAPITHQMLDSTLQREIEKFVEDEENKKSCCRRRG